MISGRRGHRRHLPHYQNNFRDYFVTFVTVGRLFLPPSARNVILRHIVLCDSYFLHVAVVMPDHAHLIVRPHPGPDGFCHPLGHMLGRIKGASSHEINQLMGRSGILWQDESFDHELRHSESLAQKCEYVRQNPVRKGLVDRPEDYPWLWERKR